MDALTRTVELVQRAQRGDREALERVLARYYERVIGAVEVRIGPRLRAELETSDILQQTFLKAVELFDRFEMRDEGSLVHWLVKIAEGQIHDAVAHMHAHKRDVERRVSLDVRDANGETTPLGCSLASDSTNALDGTARSEAQQRLLAALDALPAHYREIVVLREYEGLAWDDVARETGRPSPDAARMLYRQAMLELTKELSRRRHA